MQHRSAMFTGRVLTIQVTKRDGSKEALDIDKLHKVVWWATENR